MRTTVLSLSLVFMFVHLQACSQNTAERAADEAQHTETHKSQHTVETGESVAHKSAMTADGKIVKSEEEWRQQLSDEEFVITRQAGTERAFSGKYWDAKDDGVYTCVCCAQPLFDSRTKFKSGTGWPSYYEPIADSAIAEETDYAFSMVRIEVLCSRCDAHLGHLFNDGPQPTGMRYCINSASLDFVERSQYKSADLQTGAKE